MNALFVAIKPPATITAALKTMQPAADQYTRLVPSDRFHLTLRYIGRQPTDPFEQALSNIIANTFQLCLSGSGHFGSARRGMVLWAGIKASKELNELQKKVEAVVIAAGIEPGSRQYKPHITLARCKANTPEAVLQEHTTKEITQSFSVKEFGLYASVPAEKGPPIYQLIRSYPLKG